MTKYHFLVIWRIVLTSRASSECFSGVSWTAPLHTSLAKHFLLHCWAVGMCCEDVQRDSGSGYKHAGWKDQLPGNQGGLAIVNEETSSPREPTAPWEARTGANQCWAEEPMATLRGQETSGLTPDWTHSHWLTCTWYIWFDTRLKTPWLIWSMLPVKSDG